MTTSVLNLKTDFTPSVLYICGGVCLCECGCEKVEAVLHICQMCRVPAVSMCEHTVLLFCSSKSVPFKAVKQKALPACPHLSHFTIHRNTPCNKFEHGFSNLCLHLSLCGIYPSLQKIIMRSFCAVWNGTWCNTQTYGRKSECSLFGISSKTDLRRAKEASRQTKVKAGSSRVHNLLMNILSRIWPECLRQH